MLTPNDTKNILQGYRKLKKYVTEDKYTIHVTKFAAEEAKAYKKFLSALENLDLETIYDKTSWSRKGVFLNPKILLASEVNTTQDITLNPGTKTFGENPDAHQQIENFITKLKNLK